MSEFRTDMGVDGNDGDGDANLTHFHPAFASGGWIILQHIEGCIRKKRDSILSKKERNNLLTTGILDRQAVILDGFL